MGIEFPATPQNLALAHALERRITAQACHDAARASFTRWVGVGGLALALGCVLGLGAWAYAQGLGRRSTTAELAKAMHEALATVTLRATTTGEVTARGTVALADAQTVTLAPGAQVAIDPAASVRVEGDVRVAPALSSPAPGASIAPPPGSLPPSRSSTPAVTNYVVFKAVRFGEGVVETGWHFASSEQQAPSHQVCNYIQEINGVRARINLGLDGRLVPQSRPRSGFDLVAAFQSCVWFSGPNGGGQ